jgi:hypothetical protein
VNRGHGRQHVLAECAPHLGLDCQRDVADGERRPLRYVAMRQLFEHARSRSKSRRASAFAVTEINLGKRR